MNSLPYIDEFLLSLKNNNYSAKTVLSYERDLEILAAFLDFRGIEFDKITKLVISDFKGFLNSDNYITVLRQYKALRKFGHDTEATHKYTNPSENFTALYKGTLSSRSINRALSSLRSYLNFLVDIDQPVPIPPTAVKLVKTDKKEKQIPEFEEMVKLIESPMEFEKEPTVQLRNRTILELIFATGMRISEVINLNRDQIRFIENKLKEDKIYIKGKGNKQRFVYLTPRAISFLESYLQTREDDFPAMFIPTKGTRLATGNKYKIRLSPNYIQMKIADYRRRLGIIVPTSAHSLRHGFATYIADEGASAVAIQKLLGHESLQTTTRYIHASDKLAEKTHQDFHPLKT